MKETIRLTQEDRFSRFTLISWWDQARLARARVLVVGAGALGNEVLKNLALLGIGQVAVVDMDEVDLTNLSRSVLFREKDRGRPKAQVACEAVRSINPGTKAHPIRADVVHAVGLGLFRWADVVIGALDNREARLAVSRWCNLTRRPWIDGGIDVLSGVARVFLPDGGACYECTLSETDWKILDQRRACTLLPRAEAAIEPRVPTTPTTAAVVAGVQCAEAVKLLHGLPGLAGEAFQFDGQEYDSYRVRYTRDPGCYGHDRIEEIDDLPLGSASATVGEILDEFRRRMGSDVVVEVCRELLAGIRCGVCNVDEQRFGGLGSLAAEEALCSICGAQCGPILYHRLDAAPCEPRLPLRELGIPPWDILRGRAEGRDLGLELSGDRVEVLAPSEETLT